MFPLRCKDRHIDAVRGNNVCSENHTKQIHCVGTMPNILNITEGGTCSYHRTLTVNQTAVSSETPHPTPQHSFRKPTKSVTLRATSSSCMH